MVTDALQHRIVEALPDAEVEVRDLTGTGDHFEARIVSDAFEGKTLLERHQMIYGIFQREMQGPIHALSLKTLTPAEVGAKR